jgi:hypothetical protein
MSTKLRSEVRLKGTKPVSEEEHVRAASKTAFTRQRDRYTLYCTSFTWKETLQDLEKRLHLHGAVKALE